LETVPFARTIISGGSCIALEAVENVKLAQLELQCEKSISMLNAKNITVEQLEIASVTVHSSFSNPVEVRNSSVTMSGVEIYDSQQAGLLVTGTSKITLTNSDLHDNQFGVRIEGDSELTAEDTNFSGNSSGGIFMLDDASLTLEGSNASANGSLESAGSGLAINSTSNGSVTINNSTFSNNTSAGINVHAGFAGTNNFDVTIKNSTFARNPYGILVGDVEGPINLEKNLFVANTVYQISHRRPDKTPTIPFSGYVFALETTIEDSMGVSKQLTGLKTGPSSDTTDWEITNARNYICFSDSCVP
jgi:Right handed beta helix region